MSNWFSLILLILKNLVCRLLFKLFAPKSVKRVMHGQHSKLGSLLLAEFVFMTPTMIPGLLMDIITPAPNTEEFLFKALSSVIFFGVIACFIYYMISTTSYKRVTIQGDNVPTYKINLEDDVMVILKLLFLPFIITENQPLFFSLVTLAIISEILVLKVLMYTGMDDKRMYLYAVGVCVWIVHHICFILFWFEVESMVLGFVSMFTLMFIFLVEILKMFCKFYKFYLEGRIFYRKVMKEQKMLDKKKEEDDKKK